MFGPTRDALEFVGEAAETPSLQSLDNAFARLIECWGFNCWAAIPLLGPNRSFVPTGQTHYGRPPRTWAKRYRDAEHFRVDSIVRAMRQNDRAIWWTAFERGTAMAAEERVLFDEARDCGVNEGLTAPIPLVDGSLWMCALTSPENEPRPDVAFAAHGAMREYVVRALELRRREATDDSMPLTVSEVKILRLLNQGFNAKEAAKELKKAPKTVYHQLASAKKRMGVHTITELVRLSSDFGWLN